MKFLNSKGVITVFLALILPVVLVCGVVLADAAVLGTGRAMTGDAVRSSAYSVLGQYSSYLKNEYDIYGFCLTKEEALEIAGNTIMESLEAPAFYDFKLEAIQVHFSGSLSKPEYLKEAVLSVASDDLYENVINGFIERFNIFKGLSKAAEIVNLKMKVDEAVKKFKEAGEFLTALINGDENTQYYINCFSGITGIDISLDVLGEKIAEIEKLKSKIEELKKTVNEIESETAGQLNLMEEAMGVLRETAADIYYSEIENILSGLRQANSKAMDCIETMIEEKGNINAFSQLIDRKIKESEDLPEYMKELLLTVSDVIKDVEDEAVGLVFDIIEEKINENISILHKVASFIESEIDDTEIEEYLSGSLKNTLSGYFSNIEFSFNKSGAAGKDEDKRGFFEELGKRVLEKRIGEDVEIEDPVSLPSAQSAFTQDNRDFNVSATGESTKSAEDGVMCISGQAETGAVALMDSLCLNEYLLNHLTMETSEEEKGHFFKNEAEYILWGNPSQNLNRFYTKSALMGTRFALNAIHVYTDSSKKLKSDAIAAATAGWWTMGAGIPVMSNLVRCAWAIAESGFDVNNLCNGQSIAIIKRKADWVTDIGVEKAGVGSPDFMCMNYKDYMRIYLMMCSDEKRMSRLADIIQLNATDEFNISNSFTEISVRAVISFRSLTGGRHEETIEISRSYQGNGFS